MTFSVTEEERSASAMADEKIARVVEEIETRGFAVVSGLISAETCELLAASVLEDADRVRALGKPTLHEEATSRGHLQLGLRRYAPYAHPELLANPLLEQVVSAVLGPAAWLGFYNGNVNLPDSGHQPLHYDRPFSWRTREKAERDGQTWPPPTTTLSCSVALSDITEDTGATEVYPGTHLETAVTEWEAGERLSDHPELVERWGPPERMAIPAGGVCFRDPRMWHRGVPNPSDQARPMPAVTYHAERCRHARGRLIKNMTPADVERCRHDPTLRILDDGQLGDGRLVFDESARAAFTDNPSLYDVNRNSRFVAEPQRVNHFLDAHLIGGARVVSSGAISPEE